MHDLLLSTCLCVMEAGAGGVLPRLVAVAVAVARVVSVADRVAAVVADEGDLLRRRRVGWRRGGRRWFLVVLLDHLADLQQLRASHLLAQRADQLDGVDALAHDDHLVPGFALERHGVDAAHGRRHRHGLGPALVAAHAHPDHDLLLRRSRRRR